MLIHTQQLDEQVLADLDALTVLCKSEDGNIVAIHRHLLGKDRGRLSNILFYQQELIGFLAAFFFHENSCELSIMVAPKFRHQRVATQLLNAILPLIETEQVNQLVFSSPHDLNDEFFLAMGCEYKGSEFQMQRLDKASIILTPSNGVVRTATLTDIADLCVIDHACFASDLDDMPIRFHMLLYDPEYVVLVIGQGDEVLGKAHINWQSNCARITDIAIIPHAQGHGLGGELLSHCINYILSKDQYNIILDVETKNQTALGLYSRLGFNVLNAHDFWTISKYGLTDFLSHP